MARVVSVELVDDLDGGPAHETIRFGVASVDYEIDLSTEHADQLRRVFAPFVAAARHHRRPGQDAPAVRARHGAIPERAPADHNGEPMLSEIRQWARANGFPVSERGRISREVRAAFDATPPEVRAEQAATFAELFSAASDQPASTGPRALAPPAVTFSATA